MKNKQSSLLSQLDSLDEECASLREELQQVESNRQKLASDLQQVQASYREVQGSYEQAQKQLCSEQVCSIVGLFMHIQRDIYTLVRINSSKPIRSKTD